MKTILVPIDLSPLASAALPVAVSLAKQIRADVRLLHYLSLSILDPELSQAPVAMAQYVNEQTTAANDRLQEICNQYASDGVQLTPVLSRSVKGLYGAIADEAADLVVLASHGADGLAEWLIGSNAEHVMEVVDCPVLVVKQAYTEFTPKKVLFAIDADDRLKAQFSYPLPGADARKEFLFINTPNEPRALEGIRDWVSELAEAQKLTDYHLTIIAHQTAHEGIIQFAEQNGFDLIVLFTSQRKGFWHFFNGSVAEDVVNHSPIPVLAIPYQ
ncbi:universal stress protein [Spirosoma fluviale]|uniref:Nucleotide-binding universal stress protein, UspA family n=1 Tax=Spirosoma fluviale TaxID=1597977 RepID=A0A286GCS0_9BACT|nr:universal stress protein [Spirosoma fluviale]SOD93335.1 Nucleotide-binding universal stress protein, UspA family [Spirosoma fluviale]